MKDMTEAKKAGQQMQSSNNNWHHSSGQKNYRRPFLGQGRANNPKETQQNSENQQVNTSVLSGSSVNLQSHNNDQNDLKEKCRSCETVLA